MAYGNFKDLLRRTASDKVLRDKAFNVAKKPKYDGYQRKLASLVYKCFDKQSFAMHANKFSNANTSGGAIIRALSKTVATQNKSAIKSEIMLNQHPLELADLSKVSGRKRLLVKELQKPVIRKFGKHKVYSF